MTAYATPNDLITFFDENEVRELLSDQDPVVGDLSSDPKLLQLLDWATGRIRSYATTGNRYTPEQLDALQGEDRQVLVEMTCTMTMSRLLRRRPTNQYHDAFQPFAEELDAFTKDLRSGVAVFAIQATRDAGVVDVDGPSVVEINNLNMITSRVHNTFPRASWRLPLDRQGGY